MQYQIIADQMQVYIGHTAVGLYLEANSFSSAAHLGL